MMDGDVSTKFIFQCFSSKEVPMKRRHVAFTLPLSKADAQLIDG
jgi:hypothetical protein